MFKLAKNINASVSFFKNIKKILIINILDTGTACKHIFKSSLTWKINFTLFYFKAKN